VQRKRNWPAQTEAVMFGPGGAGETAAKDAVFISCSTMDPAAARRLGERWEAEGRLYLDAPMSGGAARAAKGELTFMASGSPAAFARARVALDAMASKVYELGDRPGIGAGFKMINQLLPGSTSRPRRRR
jgi:3-hydroxyisobutyrate dehydrogenase